MSSCSVAARLKMMAAALVSFSRVGFESAWFLIKYSSSHVLSSTMSALLNAFHSRMMASAIVDAAWNSTYSTVDEAFGRLRCVGGGLVGVEVSE